MKNLSSPWLRQARNRMSPFFQQFSHLPQLDLSIPDYAGRSHPQFFFGRRDLNFEYFGARRNSAAREVLTADIKMYVFSNS